MQEVRKEVDKQEIFKSILEDAKKELLRQYQTLSPEQRRALVTQYHLHVINIHVREIESELNALELPTEKSPKIERFYYNEQMNNRNHWIGIAKRLEAIIFTTSCLSYDYYLSILNYLGNSFAEEAEKEGITYLPHITDEKGFDSVGDYIGATLHRSHDLFNDPKLLVDEA